MDDCKLLTIGAQGRALCHGVQLRGRVVQVDPIKHALKAPEIKRLKLKSDYPLSNFAFKYINAHRYTVAVVAAAAVGRCRLTL